MSNKILCSLQTDFEDFKINDEPLQLDGNINSNDLNQLISQLLESKNELNFIYSINNIILNEDLQTHINNYELTNEEIIIIKYYRSLNEPKMENNFEENDWILNIHIIENNFITVTFSGEINYYNKEMKKLFYNNITENEEFTCSCLIKLENQIFLLSVSRNNNIYKTIIKNDKIEKSIIIYNEEIINDSIITCIKYNPVITNQIILGNSLGNVYFLKHIENNLKLERKELFHSNYITDIEFLNSRELVSISLDNTLKIIDSVNFNIISDTYLKDRTPTKLKYNSIIELLYIGFDDGYIKSFDRKSNFKNVVLAYKSHNKYISAIDLNPASSNFFVSGSYDNSLKFWDSKSDLPIYSVKAHRYKIFSVKWLNEYKCLSGSADKNILVNNLN